MRSIVPFSDMGSTFPTPRTESSRPSPDGEETHMLLQRKAAVDAVQPLFPAAEASVDRAAADAASCIAEMLRVSEEAGLPMSAGADMPYKLVVALNHNVNAPQSFIEAHALNPALVEELVIETTIGHRPHKNRKT